MLDEIMDVTQTIRRVIIDGDFNAKSEAWGFRYTNKRGELTEEWTATYDILENNQFWEYPHMRVATRHFYSRLNVGYFVNVKGQKLTSIRK